MIPHLLHELVLGLARPGDPLPPLDGRAVEEDVLLALLAAARVAPSADNLQTWRFVVVETAETRRLLAATLSGELALGVEQAPLVVVACGVQALVTRVRREQPFALIDVPIAVSHLLLQARELGLACSWTLDLDEPAVRDLLSIPEEVRLVALLALGWPAR